MGRGRIPKACEHCRTYKTRCHVPEGQLACERCSSMSIECSLIKTAGQAPRPQTRSTAASLEKLDLDSETSLNRIKQQVDRMLGIIEVHTGSIDDIGREKKEELALAESAAASEQASRDAVERAVRQVAEQAEQAERAAEHAAALSAERVRRASLPNLPYSQPAAIPHSGIPSTPSSATSSVSANTPAGYTPAYRNERPHEPPMQLPSVYGTAMQPRVEDPQVRAEPILRGLTYFFQTSPVSFMNTLVAPEYMPQVYRGLLAKNANRGVDMTKNVIGRGILSLEEVVFLIGAFKENYNHWVQFEDTGTTRELADRLLSSSNLLVAACCAVALRYGHTELRARVMPRLLAHVQQELRDAQLQISQPIEFIQAVTIIANFGDTLSQGNIVFDSWFVSSLGIQHLTQYASIYGDVESLLTCRLWNNLANAHLFASNTTGRQCLLDSASVLLCRGVMNQAMCSQFDMCILAEIAVQFMAYRYFNFQLSYEQVTKELRDWEEDWRFLTSEHGIQFADAIHIYVFFLVELHQVLRTPRSSIEPGGNVLEVAFRNAPLQEVCHHIAQLGKTLHSLMETVNANFFAFLSDQLHQIGMIASTFVLQLCTLLKSRAMMPAEMALASEAVAVVRSLADRFEVVSQSSDDAAYLHSCGLNELLSRLRL